MDKVIVTLSLDKETYTFLEDFKWDNRITKSKIVRMILKFYIKNPEKLTELISNE